MSEVVDYRAALLRSYLEIRALKEKLRATTERVAEPLAIVGMSCRFPGAPDLEGYWRLLSHGESAVGEVPAERWDNTMYYHPEPGVANTTNSKWGGFLNDIAGFDAAFFDVSPKEAFVMDPQQRLFLEVAWEAMEDSGYTPARLASVKTGVFVGCSNNGYLKLLEPFLSPDDHFVGSGNAISLFRTGCPTGLICVGRRC